uniref:4-coumarate--CoA ligase n=1 Tax=Leersia perrieri TaxID=77586 RepID=A0A0D9W1B9_9ORYZ
MAAPLCSYSPTTRLFPSSPFLLRRRRCRRGGFPRWRCDAAASPFADSKLQYPVRRKCSPLLERDFLPGGDGLDTHESDDWMAVPDIWRTAAEKYADRVALIDPYHEPPSEFTYRQLEQEILDFSQGLRVIGVAPDEKIALFAENSCRWLVADQGIMATGAINVVRGTRSSDEELFQIYTHSESIALVVDSPQFFNRLAESFISRINARFVVLLWGEKSCLNNKAVNGLPLYDFKDITQLGRESRNTLCHSREQGQQVVFETISPDDVATFIYTSGTSGTPKGVMLTHRNLLHQIKNLWEFVPVVPGDRFLSMLPPWHAYERACEYITFTYGIQQIYTTVKYLKEDLQRYQPQYLVSVPLIYETLYSSIQRQISSSSTARKCVALALIKISLFYMEAKRIYEAGISAGGTLPMHVDKFFEAIGVKLQNAYGLTETSPAVVARRPFCNNPLATNKVLDQEGWFNTGDIGWIAPHCPIGPSRKCGGMLVLQGRAKDTIVLTTGENVEPAEIEEAANKSELINQIIVIGQDKRRLGAIIAPNYDEVLATAKRKSILDGNNELAKDKVLNLLSDELRTRMADCSFQIGPILLVDEPFTVDNGLLTPTFKIRRDKVTAKYHKEIDAMYKKTFMMIAGSFGRK